MKQFIFLIIFLISFSAFADFNRLIITDKIKHPYGSTLFVPLQGTRLITDNNMPNQKGELLTSNGNDITKIAAGQDGEVLMANSGEESGLKWANITGVISQIHYYNECDNNNKININEPTSPISLHIVNIEQSNKTCEIKLPNLTVNIAGKILKIFVRSTGNNTTLYMEESQEYNFINGPFIVDSNVVFWNTIEFSGILLGNNYKFIETARTK